jgi:uncharacterized protein
LRDKDVVINLAG